MALKTALNIGAGIVILKEPFIGSRKLSYSAFNLYWPQGDRTAMRVMIAMRRNLVDKIVVEYKTDLINHFYFMFLEIQDLNLSKKPRRKTEILNIYDNQVGQGCSSTGNTY